MSDVRHVLVLPDRDAADEVAEQLTARYPLLDEPQVVREALAGEDDAEDAQWLVVIDPLGETAPDDLSGDDEDDDPTPHAPTPATLAELAEEHGGWLEE